MALGLNFVYFSTSILKFEYYKYSQKGLLNTLIGLLLLLGFITKFPLILYYLYTFMNQYFSSSFLLSYGNYFLSIFVFWTYNIILIICYNFRFTWIEKFKITKSDWPWISEKQYWNTLLKSSVSVLFRNQIVISLFLVWIVDTFFDVNSNLDLQYIPTISEFSIQILFCVLCYDMVFHIAHRLLHVSNYLYKTVHSIHHEYNSPIGISAIYAHPVEYIFGNVFPGVVGPLILGGNMHIVTLYGWTIWGLCATVEQHSGYDFSFLPFNVLPFNFGARYHEFHHNRYNYNYSSSITYLDCLFESNKFYLDYLERNEKKLNSKDDN